MQGKEIANFIYNIPALKEHFQGIFSINTMPKSLKKRQFFISNIDKDTLPGSHWVCVIKNDKNELELFDSLGNSQEKLTLFLQYCKIYKKSLVYNITKVQSSDSDTCGKFVIYFAIKRLMNIDQSFHLVVNEIFDENANLNENFVANFFEEFC